MSMAPEGYHELRTGVVNVELHGMTYFRLAGADSLSWLQGQITNDVALLESQPWLDFCLTKPTGQLLAFCRAWKYEGGLLVSTQQPEVLEQRVEATVILEDVVLKLFEKQVTCVQGPQAAGDLPSDRTGSGGYELIGDSDSYTKLSESAFKLATLEAGIPLFGIDTKEKTLPPELGASFDNKHTSYNKGCYTGQEVLMRIKSRGHTNKRWIGLKFIKEPVGTEVEHEGKVVGKIHRTAVSPAFGHIASATVRNVAAEPGTDVSVNGTEATIVEMPFLR